MLRMRSRRFAAFGFAAMASCAEAPPPKAAPPAPEPVSPPVPTVIHLPNPRRPPIVLRREERPGLERVPLTILTTPEQLIGRNAGPFRLRGSGTCWGRAPRRFTRSCILPSFPLDVQVREQLASMMPCALGEGAYDPARDGPPACGLVKVPCPPFLDEVF